VDTDRLYVTGISMGGYGTWDLITRFPDRFAAAVPICGGGDPAKAAAIAKVPVWAIHGEADPLVKVEQTRRMIAAIKAAGGQPLYSEYPTVGHDSWTPGYQEPELLPWMFAQRRGQPAVAFEKVAPAFAQPPSSIFPGEGPVQPGIWFRSLWKNRRSEWGKAKDADRGAVVFLGDSITQGWGTLAQDFPGLKVANRGISGDTTRGIRFRLKEDVIDLQPRAVNLLIGTNDIGLGATPELVAENVKAIIAELRAADPKLPIIACRVMPSDASKQRPADKIQRLNALVDEAVANDPLITRVDTFGIFASEQGNAKKEEFPDLLHPNAAGYAKWAEALQPVFQKLQLGAQ
jgi:lysophospholipase L1-like esterase